MGATQDSPGVIRHTASEHTDIGLYPNPRLDATVEETRLEGFAAMLRAGYTTMAFFVQGERLRHKTLDAGSDRRGP